MIMLKGWAVVASLLLLNFSMTLQIFACADALPDVTPGHFLGDEALLGDVEIYQDGDASWQF